MKLLLDMHSFVWWRDDPKKLTSTAFDAISDSGSEVYLSVVVAWELQIIALNKFSLNLPLEQSIETELTANGFRILSVQLSHVLELGKLPLIHKDPFDRLLISQAVSEDMTLITSDQKFTRYSVNVLW